ncbi:TPA: hypothetical protein TVN78_000954 [Streptococcus equi subsp. zooepidemicus]|nr:hypothetical protein [Streptococcus equi subsp. zooepidemicus]
MKSKQGFFSRQKLALEAYVALRKEWMRQEREYFASSGPSDPERLQAQAERNRQFLKDLKKVGIVVFTFLLVYAIMRTILGLW